MTKEIKSLIDFYLTTEVVVNFEAALDKLVSLTTKDNYLQIIDYIENCDAKTSELDLSMYIVEIANKEYQELIPIINSKLNKFIDKDAIEDLEDALKNINS